MSKEFLMWEDKSDNYHAQCTWKDGIYSVTVKVKDVNKTATWSEIKKPTFANISSEDKKISTSLVIKLIKKIQSEQEK